MTDLAPSSFSPIKSALEVATARADKLEIIPPITDPMGKHWKQPERRRIEIDDRYALMTRADFDLLPEYSATFPTGVYPGKMWKRHDGAHDPRCPVKDRRWLLVWYGESRIGPGYCSNNWRELLLSDGELPV
jgi:hypothetical protein